MAVDCRAIKFVAADDFDEDKSIFIKRSDGSWNYWTFTKLLVGIHSESDKKVDGYKVIFMADSKNIAMKNVDARRVITVIFENSPLAKKIRDVKLKIKSPFVCIRISNEEMEGLLKQSRMVD